MKPSTAAKKRWMGTFGCVTLSVPRRCTPRSGRLVLPRHAPIFSATIARMSLDTGSITPVAQKTPAGEFGGAASSSSLDETAGAEKPATEVKAEEAPKTEEKAAPAEAKPAEAKPAEAPEAPEAEKPAAE